MQQCLKCLSMMAEKRNDDIGLVEAKLAEGSALSEALKDQIDVSAYFQLAIAEKHGDVEKSIRQLGACLERRVEQQARLRGILVYPMILFVFLAAIFACMKLFLMPELKQFEASGGNETVFDWQIFLKCGILALILLLIAYLSKAFYWWSRQKALTRHHWYCELPLIGKIYRQYCYYYLSFNLGMFFQSGLDFREICDLLRQFEEKTLLYQLGEQIDLFLNQGKSLNEIVSSYPFMPKELSAFFASGETKDEISTNLLVYSEAAYKKLVRQIDGLISLVQPVLFLVIALIIIGCYLSMLLPLYSSLGGDVSMIKKSQSKNKSAFTLIEMAVVLFIISLLILLIVPNLSKQRTHADKVNTEALQTELNSQAQLYADDKNVAIETVNVKMLENDKYLTEKQAEKMQAKHLEPETYGKSESK